MYYDSKLPILQDIFGTDDISLGNGCLTVNGRTYPIVDDVVVLLDPRQYPASLKNNILKPGAEKGKIRSDFAEDIQFTFGEEWKNFPKILPEHQSRFAQYFDLVDLAGLHNARVCDLGCGVGRWSYFLMNKCRHLILVDFSEAIFIARQNLQEAENAVFFMADLQALPFRDDFADFLFCLGVLHHLPTNALEEVRRLKRFAPQLLIYLYYALDNRGSHFRLLLNMVTALRQMTCRVKNSLFRSAFSLFAASIIYLPLRALGEALSPFGLSHHIPLYEGCRGKSLSWIRQNVYDRFFTRIEQRVSKKQIMTLQDTFAEVIISDGMPYWHFLYRKNSGVRN